MNDPEGSLVYKFRGYVIHSHMFERVLCYVDRHEPVGGFLQAVICNDLKMACFRADEISAINLPAFAAYFHNVAPAACSGSREKYEAWIKLGEAYREKQV